MESQRKKINIIIVSLLLHGIALVFLLILYASPEHEWTYFDTTQTSINTPETIFSEPLQQFPEPEAFNPPIMHDEPWAELKPRASTLGGSMDLTNDNIGVEIQNTENVGIEDESDISKIQAEELSTEKDPSINSGRTDLPSPVRAELVEASSSYSSEISILKNEFKVTPVSSARKNASAKKLQAQKALASITKGYLEQLKHEGENLIKTIGGDPTKMPSAEQLKYERYLAKIQWCLQNAHNINKDKCQTHEPIEATMRVYFTLDRTGKMADLKIIQSSGSAFVDRYIQSLFELASSSFPPLPAYIKEDPYQLLYTVMVCWNVASPWGMGLMRE